MKTLYIEFDPMTTIDGVDLSRACMAIVQNAAWCARHRAESITLRTRLIAINLNVPTSYAALDPASLGERLGAEVVFATTNMMGTLDMIMVVLLACAGVCVYACMVVKAAHK